MKLHKTSLLVGAGCYLILWIGGVGSHLWYGRTPDGTTWAAPAFLFLAGLLVFVNAASADRLTLLAIGGLGFIAEAIGVHVGVPFGRYEYSDVLQPQLIRVPLVMAAAWMVLAAYVNTMLAGFRIPAWLATLTASAWMTAIDLVIDPLAAGTLNYWRWIDSGAYYGIPLQNFVGWFVVSWLIFSSLRLFPTKAEQPNLWATNIGFSILLFFTFIALAQHQGFVAGVGGGLCLFHLAIAYWRKDTKSYAASLP